MKILSFLVLVLLIFGIGFYYFLTQTHPSLSPFISGQFYIEKFINPHKKMQSYVLGFMPYWRLDDIKYVRPQLLSEFNYFSLTVGSDGHIAKVVDGVTDPGWRGWQNEELKNFTSKANIIGTDVTVTIAALDNDLIMTILDNDEYQDNLITDIITEVKTRNLQGINVDFEYFGEPDPAYKTAFTTFSKKLKAALDSEVPGTELSISIMPLAAREDDLFDFQQLVPIYDRFIGMSYDYYGASSDIAGPIAPMKGFNEGQYFFDVETTYKDYRQYIPREKLVMGVPFYGWEWAVEDGKIRNSLTYPSSDDRNYAAVISYARAKESKELKKNQCKWDEPAQETWCWYKDTKLGTDKQVWLADNRSVETRFNFAEKQGFAGVAIWTLGYDKQYSDLWDIISSKFTHQ